MVTELEALQDAVSQPEGDASQCGLNLSYLNREALQDSLYSTIAAALVSNYGEFEEHASFEDMLLLASLLELWRDRSGWNPGLDSEKSHFTLKTCLAESARYLLNNGASR